MSVFLGYARNLFSRSPGVPGRLKSLSVPLYHRPPSGIALFAPAILALDAIIIVNTVNVTWRNWRNPPASAGGELPSLRPWWVRLGVCSMEIMTGALVAASLLIYRGRTATLLSMLPPKNPNVQPTSLNRRIFIQTAGNWRNNGTIFPLSVCTLTRVEEDVLLLQVKGQFGGWQFNLDKSFVDGQRTNSSEIACKTLATHWRGSGGKGTILTSS